MKIGLTTIFFFFATFLPFSISGQHTLSITYNFIDSLPLEKADTIGLFSRLVDSVRLVPYLDSLTSGLRKNGFLSASIDTFFVIDSLCTVDVFFGRKYTVSWIRFQDQDKMLLEKNGFPVTFYEDRDLGLREIVEIEDKILTTMSKAGYPFASVVIDSISIDDSGINGNLRIDRNALITYDTIKVLGNAQISTSFLQNILKLQKGAPYNQNTILQIPAAIKNFDFLQLHEAPYVEFLNNKASIVLPLDKQKASRFDFIVGVLPRNNNGVRNFTITGDITGQFSNELGQGEQFSFQYQRLRPETQELELQLNYPFLLELPFGVDGQFSLFRNTDNFLNLQARLGIEYQLSSREKINIGWGYESSRLIAIDTARIIASRRLPDQLDVNITSGNITLSLERLNYRFNPSSGWNASIGINIGQKAIKPNLTILSLESDEFSFESAYDTMQLTTLQSELKFTGNIYFPLQTWGTVKISNRTAYKYNQKQIFQNEFYRIGGNRLLRGFNEQTIFTPVYTVFTGELRILLDQFSYLSFPFIDYGYMRIRTLDNEEIWDHAYGVGLGLNFGTQAGIFNISFAAGSRLGSGLNFGETKIHFGYVNLF